MLSNQRSRLLGLAVFAILFMVVLAAGPAFAGEVPPAATTAPAALTANCNPGLDFTRQAAQPEICPAAQPESALPKLLAKPPRHGYCICGCGATCTTDADCGGSACVAFITCC